MTVVDWLLISPVLLCMVLLGIAMVGGAIQEAREEKRERDEARRCWELERRELNIKQLERDNADFEGWLERLHEEDPPGERIYTWVRGKDGTAVPTHALRPEEREVDKWAKEHPSWKEAVLREPQDLYIPPGVYRPNDI
jgi:hypothetical protein